MTELVAATGPLPANPRRGACPACGSRALEPIIEQRAAPIHTSKLLTTRAEALAYPTADIVLELCLECGLLTNTAFDAPSHDYSASYEEVQSFSPRFREYADALAATLVERHALTGATLFEIGCGRADFLLRLTEAAAGVATAVDPSFCENRLAGPAGDRIMVRRKFFEADDVPEGVGAIVCRHTLEHVGDVSSFLGELRRGLERAPDAVVAFEVPDSLRILREVAFWDVFYEHCSYFTPGSIARAFRVSGLAPTALELTFDEQYILLTARHPGARSQPAVGVPLELEERPEVVVEAARAFRDQVAVVRNEWGDRLRHAHANGERAVIWGAGSKGVGFLSTLGLDEEIACAVDVNPAKHGMFMPGTAHEIVAPPALRDIRPTVVVVMNPAYTTEISAELAALGVDAEVLAL